MFRKKICDYLEKCGFLSHGYKVFAAVLLVLGMAYRPLRYKGTKPAAISIQPPDSVISYCPKQ